MGDTHTEPDRHTLIAEDRDSTHTTTCVGGEESSTGPSAVVRDRTGRTVKGWDFFHTPPDRNGLACPILEACWKPELHSKTNRISQK